MSRMRFKSIGALALAAGLLTVGATAPAFADHGEGGEGGIEPISISITAACESEQQGVQVDADFGLFGTSIAGVSIDGASVYEEALDSGHVGQDGISKFLPLEDGTYAVSVYVASQENVVDQVTISLPTEEGCVTEEPEPTPPSIASAYATLACVEDVLTATVKVDVTFPTGNPAATVRVTYGEEQPLNPDNQTVTSNTQLTFTGPVPEGERYFAVSLNGFNASTVGVERMVTCDTDEGTTPPPVTKPEPKPPVTKPNAPVSNPEPPAAAPQKPVVQAPPAAKPAPVVPEYNSVPVPATGDTLTAASQSSGLAPIGFAALLFAGIAGVLLTRRRLASNR